MSAWIVSKRHIDALVTAAIRHRILGCKNPSALGAMLWETNHESVSYRYDRKEIAPRYTYEDNYQRPWIVLKAIACYEYQACEHPGWDDSEARKLCEQLRARLVAEMPEFATADGWGLT